MPIVFGAIAPHGFPLIPELDADADGALRTRAALEELGRRCVVAGVEVVALAGPHGVRVDGSIALADVGRAAGRLTWRGRTVEMNVPVDGPLTDRLAGGARAAGLPLALVGYAGSRRPQSVLPLDWGAMVPLWFLGHGRHLPGYGDVLAEPPPDDPGPPVVLLTPSRRVSREALVVFGRVVVEAAEADGRRVGFVASCDWAHTHRADGPYGFRPAAAAVDAAVLAAVRAGDLNRLLALDERAAAEAAIDGLWQALILAGVVAAVPLVGEVLSYEAPTYYGMLVAAYGVAGAELPGRP